jgi:hypothetical protein
LRDVPIQNEAFCRLMGATAQFDTSTYSLVYPPNEIWKKYGGGESANLSLFSSAYISEETASWLPRFVAQMAIMQPINAEIRSAQWPEIFGSGTPAYAKGQKAPANDDILEVANVVYQPAGSRPSRWIGSDEFGRFATEYGRSDNCFGNGDPEGLTLETPFGSNSALIRLRTGDAHPQLKNGLLITVQIPFWSTLTGLLPYLQHSFWFLPNVAACHAMANLLAERHNSFWHDYEVVVAAGASAGTDWRHCPLCAKPSGADSRPRPSRSRAPSSPPA